MKTFLMLNLFRLITWLLWKTVRLEVIGRDFRDDLITSKKSFILCFWHGEQFALTRYMSDAGLFILTSLSKDGELQTRFLNGLGYRCVRGSSSRGGMKALLKLIKLTKQYDYSPVAMAVDGPRGPIYKPKEGFILLAKKTGMPFLPVRVKYHNGHTFSKAWDKYQIPKPFSKVSIIFSESYVPSDNMNNEDIINDFNIRMEKLGEEVDIS
ncbi:MAG: hypothetical protein C0601_10845 [Candidatus Muiribacterium halophilum]|uniref:DUF374 domain-containing protein n=1 Tax=Muiribacterium halophilum TaxID=2053465 RepID=A0A2N5ZBQ4_MUIH1|nr:MAG: hypothetical protein C0601_10845 [Candidatus Muirbacterium halophilum]